MYSFVEYKIRFYVLIISSEFWTMFISCIINMIHDVYNMHNSLIIEEIDVWSETLLCGEIDIIL